MVSGSRLPFFLPNIHFLSYSVLCTCTSMHIQCICMLQTYMYMINQTSRRLNKAKQIKSTRLRKSFFKKNWLPQVGFEPTTLCSPDRVLCQLSHRGSSVDMGRISYTNTKQGKANHLNLMYMSIGCRNRNRLTDIDCCVNLCSGVVCIHS